MGVFAVFSRFSGNWGFLDPAGVWRNPGSRRPLLAGDRAPPRGVDVKPPSREGSPAGMPGLASPRALSGPRRGSPRPPPGPRGPGSPPGPGRGRGFTSTPRGGALSPARGPPPGVPGRHPSSGGGAGGGAPTPGRSGGTGRRARGGQAAGFLVYERFTIETRGW